MAANFLEEIEKLSGDIVEELKRSEGADPHHRIRKARKLVASIGHMCHRLDDDWERLIKRPIRKGFTKKELQMPEMIKFLDGLDKLESNEHRCVKIVSELNKIIYEDREIHGVLKTGDIELYAKIKKFMLLVVSVMRALESGERLLKAQIATLEDDYRTRMDKNIGHLIREYFPHLAA